MKIGGQTFKGPNVVMLVLERNGEPVVFKAKAVLDYSRFDALVKRPEPKAIKKVGGAKELLTNDPKFLQAINQYSSLKTYFLIIESLSATPDLEWEKVKLDNPETWQLYNEELKEGFTEYEVTKINNLVWEANGIDESKLEEARKRFLATQDQTPEA